MKKTKRQYKLKRNIVVIGKNNTLLPIQEELIKKRFRGDIEIRKIDNDYLSVEKIHDIAFELSNINDVNIILVDTNPLLVASLTSLLIMDKIIPKYEPGISPIVNNELFVLHSIKNKKGNKEGKIISIADNVEYEIVGISH